MTPQQSSLAFSELACRACPYGVAGRCPGPDDECLRPPDDRFIGCFDTRRQMEVYLDLHRNGEPAVPEPAPSAPDFPPVIHVVQKGLPLHTAFPSSFVFGASYTTVLGEAGDLLPESAEDLRARLRLPTECRVGLVGTCFDPRLEKFWKKSERAEVWRRIGTLDLDFALGSSFSVVPQSPRFDRIFNQERNFYTTLRLFSEGVYAVPLLFFEDSSDHDLEASVEWIENHPEVRTVAVSAQLLRGRKEYEAFLASTSCLRERLPSSINLMVIGIATAERIRAAFQSLGRLTVVTSQAVTKAIYNQSLGSDLVSVTGNLQESKSELARRNAEHLQRFCEEEWIKAA